jgi:tRNA(adenine34) deaminase
MCAGAIVQARLPWLIYGATDPKAGAVHTLFQLVSDRRLNHRVETVGGVLAQESSELLSGFFRNQRALGKK